MTTELQDKPDCYGLLYEPFLTPCREKCAVRFLCKDALKERLDSEGQDAVRAEQEKLVMAQEEFVRKEVAEKAEKRATVDPEVSPLISEVIELFNSLGLKTVRRRGYVAFKIDNRNIFGINRMKAKKLQNIVKFVFTTERDQFPPDILQYVSEEKLTGFYGVNVETVEQLAEMTKKYLEIFKS